MIDNGQADKIDTDTLTKWIDNVTKTVTSSKNDSVNKITSITNENLQHLTNHTAKLMKEINLSITSTRKKTLDTKTECQNMLKEIRKDVIITSGEIDDSTISAIESINTTANSHKNELIELNKTSEKLIDRLQASKTIGEESNLEINRLIKQLRSDITSEYETFEESLMEQADDHKESYRK